MKLVLAEPRYLKESVLIISELVNEANIKLLPDRIELIAMDPASVAMVIFRLLSSAFVDYSLEVPLSISINLDSLKQVLRRAKPADIVTLELEENKLRIDLSSDTKRTFHLSLINLEKQNQKIPELKFPGSIELSSTVFNDAIDDMDIVADAVLLTIEPSKLSIEAAGNLNKARIDLQKGDDLKISLKEGKFKSKYSIEYLKKILKASKLSPIVNINFSNDYPLKIQYKVIDKLDLEFILAPRVQND